MIHRYLGTPTAMDVDGADLIFPHHENETAQAMCAWHAPLANVWMHTGMLQLNNDKMSKSQGNFYTLKEVLDNYSANAVRILMLQTHYRAPLDFSFDRLDGAVSTLERLTSCVKNLRWAAEAAPADGNLTDEDRALGAAIDSAHGEFVASMDDDFNTAGGLAAIFGLVTASNKYLSDAAGSIETAVTLRAADALMELCGVLGIDLSKEVAGSELPAELVTLAAERASYAGTDPEEAAEALLEARQAARVAKDWGTADAIRDGIAALGLVVEDTAAGARLRRTKD